VGPAWLAKWSCSVCVPATAWAPLPARPKTFLTHCAIRSVARKQKATGIAGTLRPDGAKRSFVPGFATNRSDSAGVGFKAPGRARARGLGTKASTGSGPIAARVVGFKAPGPARARRSEGRRPLGPGKSQHGCGL
jgi:hypothetical protein